MSNKTLNNILIWSGVGLGSVVLGLAISGLIILYKRSYYLSKESMEELKRSNKRDETRRKKFIEELKFFSARKENGKIEELNKETNTITNQTEEETGNTNNNQLIKRGENMVLPALAIAGIAVTGVIIISTAVVAAVVYYDRIKPRPKSDEKLKTCTDEELRIELQRIIKSYRSTHHKYTMMKESFHINDALIDFNEKELDNSTKNLEYEKQKQNPSKNVIETYESEVKEFSKIIKKSKKACEQQKIECLKFFENLKELKDYFEKVEGYLKVKYLPSNDIEARIMDETEIALNSKLKLLEGFRYEIEEQTQALRVIPTQAAIGFNSIMHETSKLKRKISLTDSIEMDEVPQKSVSQQGGVIITEIPLDDEVDKLHGVSNRIELPNSLKSRYVRTHF